MDGNNIEVVDLQESIIEAGDTVVSEDLTLNAKAKQEESILDKHARNYATLIHPFCNYVDRMSLKSLRRVVKALAKYPLEMDEFRPQGASDKDRQAEKMAFGTGHAIFTSKYMMTTIVKLMEDVERANKEIEQQTNIEGEVKNG